MKQGEIRCDKCVNWDRPREDRVNGRILGECHRNPPMNMDQYTPGYAVWTLTHDNDWCGEFRNPQMVVDAALPKPQPVPAYHLYNLAPSSGGDPQPTNHMVPLQAGEMLERIRASLRDYPANGGDVVVMNEVDRIVREAVEKAVTKRPPCQHRPPVLYCAKCCDIIVSSKDVGLYRIDITKTSRTGGTTHIALTACADATRIQKVSPVPEDRCLCGGVGCNSCEPGGRG